MFRILSKHWSVFRESWKQESEARKSKREYREHEFLPAALEILERPPSPVGRAIGIAIAAFFLIALVWSIFGRIDVVASAAGKTLPRERVKVIQPMELGVVRAIHVADGQRVQRGDILLELDPTNAVSDEENARQQYFIAQIDLSRNDALLRSLEGKEAVFQSSVVDDPLVISRQNALIQAAVDEYQARIATVEKQRDERSADLAVITRELSKLHELLPLVREQVTAREELLVDGYTAKLPLLEQKERYIAMVNDAQIARDQIVKAKASIAAIDRQKIQIREEFRKTILSDLAEAEARSQLAQQELSRTTMRRKMQSLVAPVEGVVQQLAVHTLGGVVQPAEPVMVIVPGGGELIVEALVLNKDIGFIEEGNTVEVKLEAFPFTRYGVVDGTLEDISNDAIQDETLGLVYKAQIKLLRQDIKIDGKSINLTPGLTATAEIKTGKRRVIEFLLSPLLRYRDEALRER